MTTTTAPDLVHECELPPQPPEAASARGRSRLIGVDAARGLALVGMFAVHTISAVNSEDELSLAWALSSGKASALFAVLGGIGIAFMTGRTRVPRGTAWARAACTPVVRGLLIAAIGLTLGQIVDVDDADIILLYLGAMFVVSAVFLPLRPRTLVALGLGWAVTAPIIGHLLRLSAPAPLTQNPTFADLVTQPAALASTVFLTGYFPVLTWTAYIVVGLGIGRSDLSRRGVVAWLVGGGTAVTAVASITSAALGAAGLRDLIARDVASTTTLETVDEYFTWGGDGTLPVDSAWWLGVNAPHTGTPLDLLYTSGIAMVVIGIFLALSMAAQPMLRILAIPGSMTLTLYSAHLLLLAPLRGLPDLANFLLQLLILGAFAHTWRLRFSKGPLEAVVATVTRAVTPRRRAAPDPAA